MNPNSPEKRNLPRLAREAYQGLAYGHWVFNIKDKKRGWLTDLFFVQFQLIATHTFQRYKIATPCICLMPDHIHFLLIGYDARDSDQNLAIRFLRKHLKRHLAPFEFQKTPYDHVLRKDERERGSFQNHATYVRENPVRAGLITPFSAEKWPFECAIIPGYPDLDTSSPDYWDTFWKIYYRILIKE